jgi:hypothetical protein
LAGGCVSNALLPGETLCLLEALEGVALVVAVLVARGASPRPVKSMISSTSALEWLAGLEPDGLLVRFTWKHTRCEYWSTQKEHYWLLLNEKKRGSLTPTVLFLREPGAGSSLAKLTRSITLSSSCWTESRRKALITSIL